MNLSTWWLFVLMTFVVSATPGPNMLYVMSVSARSGAQRHQGDGRLHDGTAGDDESVGCRLGCLAAVVSGGL